MGLLTALSIGYTTLAQSNETPKDKFSGNIEIIKSTYPEMSYIRTTDFYELPADLTGNNWIEFYTNGTYMGRNTVSKQIFEPISLQHMTRYCTESKLDNGIGVSIDFTFNSVLLSMYGAPIFINYQGNKVSNSSLLGIFASTQLSDKLKLSGFAEINPSGKEGAEWSFGELNLEYIINENVSLSYNPAFYSIGPGSLNPEIDHRITLKYTFK